MSTVGQIEKKTQRRIVKLFRDTLGYDYLGDWTDRAIVAQTSAFEVCGSSRAMDQMKGVEKESVILPAAYN